MQFLGLCLRLSQQSETQLFVQNNLAFRCLVWVNSVRYDGSQVVFAAGQIGHRAGIAHVPEAPCAGFRILDDASRTPEDRVVVPERLRTLGHGRPWHDDQFASSSVPPSRDMSR